MSDYLILLKSQTATVPNGAKISFGRFSLYGDADIYENEQYVLVCDGNINTEDFVKSLSEINLSDGLKTLNGNFALALFDKAKDTLFIARDRLGTKQLYYTENTDGLWISTSFTPLFEKQNNEIDTVSLQQFFTFQYVPEPLTLGKNIFALEAGHYACCKDEIKIEKFRKWTPKPDENKDYETFKDEVKDALTRSVDEGLSGHKKIAAFLSGGLDSSILVTLAAKNYPSIETYTVDFDVKGFSEAGVASRTAESLGISHKSIKVDSKTFAESFPEVVRATGVPVADPSVVAVSLIAKGVAENGQYDAVLSGEGSDELWGGYHVYNPPEIERKIASLPMFLKKILWFFVSMLPKNTKGRGAFYRGCVPLKDRYVGNTFIFTEKEKKKLLKNIDKNVCFRDITRPYFEEVKGLHNMHVMQYVDTCLWLPGDINVVAGKNGSYRGLNVVMPFTDNRVTELAERLTVSDKLKGSRNKRVLRDAFEDILTKEVVEGKKKGYPVPVRLWLREELNDWAKDIIAKADVDKYINKAEAYRLLEVCKNNQKDIHTYRKVWSILTFCMWMIENKGE